MLSEIDQNRVGRFLLDNVDQDIGQENNLPNECDENKETCVKKIDEEIADDCVDMYGNSIKDLMNDSDR